MIRAIASLAVCVSVAYAQSASGPQFEAASIKPSHADPGSFGIHTANERLTARNVTLKRCIMGAYAVGPNQIFGGPDWLDSDRWDITAKAEQPGGDLMTMLQTLLAERFKLALHREPKPIEVYVLEVAKNGPNLKKGDGQGDNTNSGRGGIVATNVTMDRLTELLARQMDLPVINRTELEGVFKLKLRWTPENARPEPADGAISDGPSIFTALQEQLGLRMHAQKEPVEVVVIDHVERPSEN